MSGVNQGDTQDFAELFCHSVLGPVPTAKAIVEYGNMIPHTAAKFSGRTGTILLDQWLKHMRVAMDTFRYPIIAGPG